jgi:hypothetical protein
MNVITRLTDTHEKPVLIIVLHIIDPFSSDRYRHPSTRQGQKYEVERKGANGK